MRHILIVYYVLVGSLTFGQKKESVTVYKYTQKDGINSYNIRRVTEDRYGFIWVATQDGLSRFDGKNFVSYTRSAEPRHRICGIDIRELVRDSVDDLLWVLPGEVGINAINTLTGDVVKTILIPTANNEDWNICMLKDGNYLWIGTFGGLKLYNIVKGRFEYAPMPSVNGRSSVEFEVRSVLRDHNGNIWVGYSGYGIVVYDGATKSILRTIPVMSLDDRSGSRSIRFLRSCEVIPGSILFATDQGLRRVDFDRFYTLSIDDQPCRAVPGLNYASLEYVSRNDNGVMVAGSSGMFRLDRGLLRSARLEDESRGTDSKWLEAVQCIFTDLKGNLWLGCQEGLAFIPGREGPFDSYVYDERSRIKLDHVRSIYPLSNGDLLAGLRNGLVYIDHITRVFTLIDSSHTYHHIFEVSKNRLIVSRPDGLFILQKARFLPIGQVYPEFMPWRNVFVNSHLAVNDTMVVLGTESNDGILVWDPIHARIRQIARDTGSRLLASNIVNNIYRDSLHRLWVLSDNVITIISPDLRSSRELDLPYKLYFDMCEAKGKYWVASYGSGVLELDSLLRTRRLLNTGTGLVNDGVYQLYNLAKDRLLITTNNGISVVDLNTFACRNYSSGEGLHSNGFEEVCGLRKGGYIYAGGLNGFTTIDADRFTTDTAPPLLYFSGVHTQLKDGMTDTSDLHLSRLRIPKDWLQTEVSFSGLNFSSPGKVHYQYRFSGKDTTWLQLGGKTFLDLIGLAPGSYTLEVRAANEDGFWSAIRRLTLEFEPKWYETMWFRWLIVVVTGLLLYIFYRYRIGEIRKQQQIRTGIASDLHDDIGSLLNSVKVFSHLARKDPERQEYFVSIDESLTQATMGLRDMIWVLDNSEDTGQELLDRIRKFALPIAAAYGVELHFHSDLDEKEISLNKTEKRNLLLVAKEAINNSLKYSGCRNLTIAYLVRANGILLRVEDDGKGFDASQPTFGNGLRNMAERARQIKYHFRLVTRPSGGTCVVIARNDPGCITS